MRGSRLGDGENKSVHMERVYTETENMYIKGGKDVSEVN